MHKILTLGNSFGSSVTLEGILFVTDGRMIVGLKMI